jgi:hypothetical protein
MTKTEQESKKFIGSSLAQRSWRGKFVPGAKQTIEDIFVRQAICGFSVFRVFWNETSFLRLKR